MFADVRIFPKFSRRQTADVKTQAASQLFIGWKSYTVSLQVTIRNKMNNLNVVLSILIALV